MVIEHIKKLIGTKLQPATGVGYDPALAVMGVRHQQPQRYLLDEQSGKLIGLNLSGCKLDDKKWEAIMGLEGFDAGALQALNLRDNVLTKSPVTPAMKALRHLDLSNNKLQEVWAPLQLEHVLLYGNEISTPPLEIVEQGKDAVLNFYRSLETQGAGKIFEAKVLLVGAGGVGKTTLLRRLLYGAQADMPTEAESTHGIEVHDLLPFPCEDGHAFKAHAWDFGGQEIYHATHQFFLTKRSLYLLVSDARKEDTDFDYWLQIIQLLGADSPVIIVQNEKGGRKKNINLSGLQAQFPNVVSLHSLDLSTTDGLDELISEIQARLRKLPHVGETLPKHWADIRNKLNELKTSTPYISAERFYTLCAEHGEPEEAAVRLGEYLHDLGAILHFSDDAVLKHTVFLDNAWVTEGVYAVLDSRQVQDEYGKFTRDDAIKIWKNRDEKIFKNKHDELLRLMLKFEICYRLPDDENQYIAPQLLPANEPAPALEWEETNSLHLIYRYGFMPKGMMSRMVVRLNRYIQDHKKDTWQSGAILHRGKQAMAKMYEVSSQKEIHLNAKGKEGKALLTLISEELDRLNNQYEKIKVDKWVPCICAECLANRKMKDWQHSKSVFLYDYEKLENARHRGVKTIQCHNSYEPVEVLRLLDSIFVTNFFAPKALKLFISYSKADKAHLHALEKQLSPLLRDGKFTTWSDTKLLPGEEWDTSIRQQLSASDVIIMLVSSDFLATDYVWQEIDIALERHKAGEALVVPVIVRPCVWTGTPIARFNALPEKGMPITKWDDQDEAWQEVVDQIVRLSGSLNQA